MQRSDSNFWLDPALFAQVVREVFSGESWEAIEPYAARAWTQLVASDAVQWDEVKEVVHEAWETSIRSCAPLISGDRNGVSE